MSTVQTFKYILVTTVLQNYSIYIYCATPTVAMHLRPKQTAIGLALLHHNHEIQIAAARYQVLRQAHYEYMFRFFLVNKPTSAQSHICKGFQKKCKNVNGTADEIQLISLCSTQVQLQFCKFVINRSTSISSQFRGKEIAGKFNIVLPIFRLWFFYYIHYLFYNQLCTSHLYKVQ